MQRLRTSAAAILLVVFFVGTCSSDTVCPGLWDFCYVPRCSPHFLVKTSDGSPSIASAGVLAGDCLVDETGFIDGGVHTAAAVLVYAPPYVCSANPSPCTVQVTFTNGGTTTVTDERLQGASMTVGQCEDNTNCCERSRYTERSIYECGFVQSELTLDVSTASDGSVID
jgi:hypothetical protein